MSIRSLLVPVAICAAFTHLSLPVTAQTTSGWSFYGRVIDSRTRAPLQAAQISIEGGQAGALSRADGTFGFNLPATRPLLLRVSLHGYCPWIRTIDESWQVNEVEIALDFFPPPPSDGPPMARMDGDRSVHWPTSDTEIRCLLDLQEEREGRVRQLGDVMDWQIDLLSISVAVLLDDSVAARGHDIRGSGPLWVVLDVPHLDGYQDEAASLPFRLVTPQSALLGLDEGDTPAVAVITMIEVSYNQLAATVHFETPGRQWERRLPPATVRLERQGAGWRLR